MFQRYDDILSRIATPPNWFDEQGVPHTVWTGADSTKTLDYLVVEFPKTTFKTGRVKLTLATNVVGGWNEIDAVQLVGTEQ